MLNDHSSFESFNMVLAVIIGKPELDEEYLHSIDTIIAVCHRLVAIDVGAQLSAAAFVLDSSS